jgi:hypothetical protein
VQVRADAPFTNTKRDKSSGVATENARNEIIGGTV